MNELSAGPPSRKEQRRASRFTVIVPVRAKWQGASGKTAVEDAQAREVNTQGGLLEMKTFPPVGTQIEVTNLLSQEICRARAIGIRRKQDRIVGLAIELLIPSETFWGINFQLKKTSAELLQLENAIRTGGIDSRILKDFREAIDYVRKTAWAVQEWQEREITHHDPHTLLPLLTSERIRRAAQLSHAIVSDLAAHEVTRETPGVEELLDATQHMQQLLAGLLRTS